MTRPGIAALVVATVAHAALFVIDRYALVSDLEPLSYALTSDQRVLLCRRSFHRYCSYCLLRTQPLAE